MTRPDADKEGLPENLVALTRGAGQNLQREDGKAPIVLTPEQRKELLGKLIDFEIKLAELPQKQANFVLAVLKDPTNWDRAARIAGYVNSSVQAARMRHIPKVMACIALGENVREDRTYITTDRTLHEYAIIAFSDISMYEVDERGRLKVRDGIPEYMTRAVSQVHYKTHTWTEPETGIVRSETETKFRLWSKPEALKMLATYQKLIGADWGNAPAPTPGVAMNVLVQFQQVNKAVHVTNVTNVTQQAPG